MLIFFVISGYLITSIIYRESIINKNFSLLNFYERRARRLLPALLTVLFFTLFFAYHLLLPVQFVEYLKTVISSMFFYQFLFSLYRSNMVKLYCLQNHYYTHGLCQLRSNFTYYIQFFLYFSFEYLNQI